MNKKQLQNEYDELQIKIDVFTHQLTQVDYTQFNGCKEKHMSYSYVYTTLNLLNEITYNLKGVFDDEYPQVELYELQGILQVISYLLNGITDNFKKLLEE